MGCILVLLVKHVMLIIGIIRAMHNYYPGMNHYQLLQSCVSYNILAHVIILYLSLSLSLSLCKHNYTGKPKVKLEKSSTTSGAAMVDRKGTAILLRALLSSDIVATDHKTSKSNVKKIMDDDDDDDFDIKSQKHFSKRE